MRNIRIKDIKDISDSNKKMLNDLNINYDTSRSISDDVYKDDLKYNYDNYCYEYILNNKKIADKTCEFLNTEIFKDDFLLQECKLYINNMYDSSELYTLFKIGIIEDICNDFGIDIAAIYFKKYKDHKLVNDYINNSQCNLSENYYGDMRKIIWNCPNCFKENKTLLDFEFKNSFIYCNCGFKTTESQIHKMKGIILIDKLLKKHNLNYQKYYNLSYCKTSEKIEYDFMVEYNKKLYYLEINSLNCYIPINYFGGIVAFNEYKDKYEIKKKYAEKNGVFIGLDYRENNLNLLKNRFYNNFYHKYISDEVGK